MARRQFDLDFKKRVVKAARKLRKVGERGELTVFLRMLNIGKAQLYYWENQMAKGLLKKRYAVAFSRNPSQMVKGKEVLA